MSNNSTTSSTTGSATEQIAAWLGLDWADKEHKISLYDTASSRVESYSLKQTPEAIQEWLAGLKARYNGAKVAVALEQSRGAVINALIDCDFIVLYPVNPQALHSYRKAFASSGAKNDPTDAQLLQDIVRKHPEKFRAWAPEDASTRSIRLLAEDRRRLVDQLTKLTNQLTSCLKTYFPQALKWAGELDTEQACDFLKKWPTLEQLHNASPTVLRNFFMRYGRPRKEAVDLRLKEIKQAVALTRDPAAVLTGSMKTEALVAQIRPLPEMIKKYDDQINQLFQSHPDRLLFKSFPGAGAVLAPRLMVAFGVDRAYSLDDGAGLL